MKNLKNSIKMMLFVIVASLVFASCNEDDDKEMREQNIVQIASSNSEFSSLVAALQKTNLAGVLEGSGPFTVFAPTNAAFTALFQELGVSGLDEISADALTPVLLNHVVSGDFKSSMLLSGYVTTANNNGPNSTNISLYISVAGGVKINGNVNITTADIDASNGVIHVIDAVILPTNVVDIAVQNSNFTSLVSALGSAEGNLVGVLSGDGPFTVFAPTNAAFEAIAGVTAGLSPAELADVLKYHVVSGNVRSSMLSNGMTVTTLNGSFIININGSSASITDDSGNTVSIIATDIQGTNGVVHVIDAVLLK